MTPEDDPPGNRRHLRVLDVVLAIVLAAIAAVPPSLVALAAYFKAGDAATQAGATHQLVNSRMTEMLELTKKQSADAATLAEKQKQEQIKLIEQAAPVPIAKEKP